MEPTKQGQGIGTPSKDRQTVAGHEQDSQPMLSRGGQAADRPARHGLGYYASRFWAEVWLPLLVLLALCIAMLIAWCMRKPEPPKVAAPEVKIVQPPFEILHGVNAHGVTFYFQKRPDLANSRITFQGQLDSTVLSIWSGAVIETKDQKGFLVLASGPASGHEQVTLSFREVSPAYAGVLRYSCSSCPDFALPAAWSLLKDL